MLLFSYASFHRICNDLKRGLSATTRHCMTASDLGCKQPMPSSRLTVQPEEFCVRAGESRDVLVIVQPSDKNVAQCSQGPAIVATLALLYGDEISRQQLRR